MSEPMQNRLLVVDDDRVNRMVMGRYLENEGHQVEFAVNGLEALEKLRTSRFDMVLLDIEMPEMNGYQVLEHIRQVPQWRDMPVIVTSALEELDSVVRCIENGAEDYLTKPVNRVLLKARIDASLEKKRLRDRQTELLNQLEREMEIARKTQQSILPERLPEPVGYEFGALMIPARAVGGDFYEFFDLGGNRWGIVIGDVSDKGLPAALFMTLTYSLMKAEAERGATPGQVVREVNRHLLGMNASTMFVTILYGILDCNSGEFSYARAGHLAPALFDSQGSPMALNMNPGQPIGLFEDFNIDEATIQVPPNGLLVLSSDGLTEPVDQLDQEFGEQGMIAVVQTCQELPPQQVCDALWQAVQKHCGPVDQQDDFTLVVVRRSG
jgi:sigma-B regulation protein RsbU (phosphoserine phosphatase)